MASVREHVRIDRSADEVWKVVSDVGAISEWFPGIETSSASGDTRSCTMAGGVELNEEIVTKDDVLRRLQYRLVGGSMPIEHHLATVDVIEDPAGALVVYATDVKPDDLAPAFAPALAAGVRGLKEYVESR